MSMQQTLAVAAAADPAPAHMSACAIATATATATATEIPVCWLDLGRVVTGMASMFSDGSLYVKETGRIVLMGRDVHPIDEQKELSRLGRSAWSF